MKIIKLSSENVKRLHVVEIAPGDGAVVTIGGRNGAGKSSVLDSVAYALGGQSLVPSEPIRKGETSAKIVVDLGDLVVTREFKRERIKGCIPSPATVAEIKSHTHAAECEKLWTWGSTTSTLIVKNKEGITQGTPQAILDKLLGKLTFDPLAFSRADSKAQRETLARLVGVDTSTIDAQRKAAFDRRTALNRDRKAAEAQLAAAPSFKDVPTEEVLITNITQQLELAEILSARYNKEREKTSVLARAELDAQQQMYSVSHDVEDTEAEINRLQAKLEHYKKEKEQKEEELRVAIIDLETQKQEMLTAQENVPDTVAIRATITEAEQTNRKVRANQKREELRIKVIDLELLIGEETERIEEIEDEKIRIMVDATYPVPGLGLSNESVIFNNLPFDQISTSEQLKVSIAIGLAMNPTLKVLLIRNGNALDSDSLRQVAEQAAAADAQVWLEYVTESADGISVMIADGEVVVP